MPLAVAALAGFVATSWQLRVEYGYFPFGNTRATAWWVALGGLDAVVASIGAALTVAGGQSTTASLAKAATVGILLPLGLRSPVRSERLVLGKPIQPGLTLVYDQARVAVAVLVEDYMAQLRIVRRHELASRVGGRGWTLGAILVQLDTHLSVLRHRYRGDDHYKQQVLESASLAVVSLDESRRIEMIVQLLIDQRLFGLIRTLEGRVPTDDELTLGEGAVAAASKLAELSFRLLNEIDRRPEENFGGDHHPSDEDMGGDDHPPAEDSGGNPPA